MKTKRKLKEVEVGVEVDVLREAHIFSLKELCATTFWVTQILCDRPKDVTLRVFERLDSVPLSSAEEY